MNSLFYMLILVILRMVLRRTWLTLAVFFVLGIGAYWPAFSSPTVYLIYMSVSTAVLLALVFRGGFLSLVVATSVWFLLIGIPITSQVSSWIFGGTLVVLGMVVGLAIYGLRTALAGRPLFPDEFRAPTSEGLSR